MIKFFTAGYGGHPARSLVLLARAMDAFVLDIRHVPYSKAPGWSKAELLFALDTRYFHVPQLGNVNVKTGGPIQLKDAQAGIDWAIKLAQCHQVIFLCGCQDFHSCHRKVVYRLLRERGLQCIEIEWPDVPKLDLSKLPDKALSVMQPWAWLLAAGIKDIENRDWSSKFKGRFLIHASKTYDMDGWKMLCEDRALRKIMPNLGEMDRGGLVGVATMTGCVLNSESRWFVGEYGFTIADAAPVDFMELRGNRGFFSVKEQLEAMRTPKAASKEAPKRKHGAAANEPYSQSTIVQDAGALQGTLF